MFTHKNTDTNGNTNTFAMITLQKNFLKAVPY